MKIVNTEEQQLAGRIATLKARQAERTRLCDQIRAQMDGTIARQQLEIDNLEATYQARYARTITQAQKGCPMGLCKSADEQCHDAESCWYSDMDRTP